MFHRLTLFFLFSATLFLPTTCDVNFNTSSMFLVAGQNHSKIINKVDDLFMASVGRKNCSSRSRSLRDTTNQSCNGNNDSNGSRACIINATSQRSTTPVSAPDLKSPPQSSPHTRRSRSISLPPGSAPAPAPESMFPPGGPDIFSSHDDQVNWTIIIIVGVVSAVIGGCIFILCCFRRVVSAVIGGCFFVLCCFRCVVSVVIEVYFFILPYFKRVMSVVIGGYFFLLPYFRRVLNSVIGGYFFILPYFRSVLHYVIGGCFFILRYFRRKSSVLLVKFCFTPVNDSNIEAFLRSHGAIAQKRYTFSEVKKMTNSFKVKLGQGGFGTVYKGKLLTGSPVAVKLLNTSKRNSEDFINEVASISRTSHVNIVTLLGFCLEGSKKALIYEFMANGSLDKFIYKRGPENIASLSWENLYEIAIGIARGLEYLHRGCNTKILHFDIKPHNILLDENFCPKISDFGLAKLCPRNESIISVSDARGTMGYVAPEMINRHFGGVSQKSDVYSYGMMLLEMVGGRRNINPEASHTSEIYFPHLAYKRLDEVDNEIRPYEVMNEEEDEIAKRMSVVGLWCIQSLPNDRPTMSRVVEMLEGNTNSLEMPPKPLFSSPTRSETL